MIGLLLGSSAAFAQDNAALKRRAADKLVAKMMTEEAFFGEKIKEQEVAGNDDAEPGFIRTKSART